MRQRSINPIRNEAHNNGGLSLRLKTQREGCQFVMNLSTSFCELKLLLLFPFCFVLPRLASGLFWFDSNGNGRLRLTPTLLRYLFLYFISTPPIGVSFSAETFHFPLSLQTPFWSPSVTTEPPSGEITMIWRANVKGQEVFNRRRRCGRSCFIWGMYLFRE